MGISRQTAGVAMLAAGALTFFYVLLLTEPSEAQSGGSTGGGSATSCSNGENQVDSFSGTGSQTTDTFTIEAPEWRYLYEASSASTAGNISLEALDPSGNSVPFSGSNIAVLPDGDSSSIGIDGPGTFTLEIEADNDVTYDVVVCQRATPAPTPAPTTAQNGTSTPKATPKQKEKVMRETVPKRPLPPTGGAPTSYAVYGFVLGGASLLALGLVRRGR